MKKFLMDFKKHINWINWLFYFVLFNTITIISNSSLDIFIYLNALMLLFLVGAYFTSKYESNIFSKKIEKSAEEILDEIGIRYTRPSYYTYK